MSGPNHPLVPGTEANAVTPAASDGKAVIADLRRAVAACRLCRDGPEYLPGLPHEPRPVLVVSRLAPVLIAGQAPGKRVHETGIPFNDPSGDRLRDWLGVDRDRFYDPDRFAMAPMGFCFPGYNAKGYDLPPRRECAPRWRQPVMAAMPQVRLVLVIGQHAQAWHLARHRAVMGEDGGAAGRSMTETVSRWRTFFERPMDGVRFLPLPHPSWRNSGWLRRNPWFEAELLPVLKKHVDHLTA